MHNNIVFGVNMEKHVSDVKEAVTSFLRNNKPAKYNDLFTFMESKFRMADEEMFKEWLDKEFPNQIVWSENEVV